VTATAERIEVPATALVLLIGAAGSGKSTFAARHFESGDVVSSDQLRARIGDSESDQRVNEDVFERLHALVQDRLAAGVLTIIDATNTDWMRRSQLIGIARRYGRPVIAIVFDLPLEMCLNRIAGRPRMVRAAVVRRQVSEVRRDRERLDLEGFAAIYVLASAHEVEDASVDIKKGPVVRALSS
jgi:protein phosphatase